MKKEKTILVLVFILLISCNKNRIVEYYPDAGISAIYYINDKGLKEGKYEAFFKNGKIKKKMVFKNGKNVGTSFFYFKNKDNYVKTIVYHNDSTLKQRTYYENNNIRSEGTFLHDSIRIGNWKFYDSLGKKSSEVQYLLVNNQSHLNQRWIFNREGDTIGGAHYSYRMKDTVTKGQYIRTYFFLERPVISDSSQLFVCIPKENDLKKDFSNENKIEWDTIKNMSLKFKGKEKYKNWNHDVIFDLEATFSGKNHLRGFLLEKQETPKDTFDFVTYKMYFDIPYFVKDSLKSDSL